MERPDGVIFYFYFEGGPDGVMDQGNEMGHFNGPGQRDGPFQRPQVAKQLSREPESDA